jgi:uncharacterized membrane protein HdeD (DUF308 family)
MEWFEAAILMVGLVLGLMALGFPVAMAFIIANMVGVLLFMGGHARHQPVRSPMARQQ